VQRKEEDEPLNEFSFVNQKEGYEHPYANFDFIDNIILNLKKNCNQ
jgi:hypothetical protein